MTVRSIILGLISAVVLCAICLFNSDIIRNCALIGSFLPLLPLGGLILFLLLLNPLLARLKCTPLTGRELAVVLTLTLFVCTIPMGLMRSFTNLIMIPNHLERANPGWQGGPVLVEFGDVLDWPGLLALLQKNSDATDRAAPWVLLRSRMPPDFATGSAAGETPNPEQQREVIDWLNRLIEERDLFPPDVTVAQSVPVGVAEWMTMDRALLDDRQYKEINRSLIDSAFPKVLRPRRASILEYVPSRMLADVGENTSESLDGFVTGMAQSKEWISPGRIPFHAWEKTLWFWIPLIITMAAALIGLGLMVHKQWSDHEHLPYPIASFIEALLPGEGESRGGVFRNRLFWIGFGFVATIDLWNYAARWWPKYLVGVSLRFDFNPIGQLLPIFNHGWSWVLFSPKIFFSVIGLAYFLATAVSLSVGVAPYLYCAAIGIFATYGVAFGGGPFMPEIETFLFGGAYFGIFLVAAYTGRHFYGNLIKRAFGFRTLEEVPDYAVAGGRLFLVAASLFVFQLTTVGVEWPFAVMFTLVALMTYVGISRLVCETGVYFISAPFMPSAILWGFLGAKAVGPDMLLVMALIGAVLLINAHESLLPFVSTGLRVVDRNKVSIGRTATAGGATFIIGLFVALMATLYIQYQFGTTRGDSWSAWEQPKWAFDGNSNLRHTLAAQGVLEQSRELSGLAHFSHVLPKRNAVAAFGITCGLVLLFSYLRHRFQKWPLHPILFVVLATWQSAWLAFSCLIGCAIKTAVTTYGGARLYQRLKPLMIGLIAGELVGALIPALIGAVYYFSTGNLPKEFSPIPR